MGRWLDFYQYFEHITVDFTERYCKSINELWLLLEIVGQCHVKHIVTLPIKKQICQFSRSRTRCNISDTVCHDLQNGRYAIFQTPFKLINALIKFIFDNSVYVLLKKISIFLIIKDFITLAVCLSLKISNVS
jgi:hypothetical protein